MCPLFCEDCEPPSLSEVFLSLYDLFVAVRSGRALEPGAPLGPMLGRLEGSIKISVPFADLCQLSSFSLSRCAESRNPSIALRI